jgi:hypothetical protein
MTTYMMGSEAFDTEKINQARFRRNRVRESASLGGVYLDPSAVDQLLADQEGAFREAALRFWGVCGDYAFADALGLEGSDGLAIWQTIATICEARMDMEILAAITAMYDGDGMVATGKQTHHDTELDRLADLSVVWVDVDGHAIEQEIERNCDRCEMSEDMDHFDMEQDLEHLMRHNIQCRGGPVEEMNICLDCTCWSDCSGPLFMRIKSDKFVTMVVSKVGDRYATVVWKYGKAYMDLSHPHFRRFNDRGKGFSGSLSFSGGQLKWRVQADAQ